MRTRSRRAQIRWLRLGARDHLSRILTSRKFAIAVVLIGVLIPLAILAVLVPRLVEDRQAFTESTAPDLYEYQEERRIEVWLSVDDFNPSTQTLSYNFNLRPAFPLVGIPANNTLLVPPGTDLRLEYSNFGFNTESLLEGGGVYQGLSGRITAAPFEDSDLFSFPFDAYRGIIVIRGWIENSGQESMESVSQESREIRDATEELWGPAELEYRYPGSTTPPDTFDLWVARVSRLSLVDPSINPMDRELIQDDVTKGFYVLNAILFRDSVTQVIAIGLGILFWVLAAIGLILFLVTLLGHRPPSLAALVWINSLIFTTIIARTAMPGSPPIGVDLDLRTYFPALIILTIASLGMSWLWIARRNSIPGSPKSQVGNLDNPYTNAPVDQDFTKRRRPGRAFLDAAGDVVTDLPPAQTNLRGDES